MSKTILFIVASAIASVAGLAASFAALSGTKPAVPQIVKPQQATAAQQTSTPPAVQQTTRNPFAALQQAAPATAMLPTIPEFQAGGAVHVNGIVAWEVGWGGAEPPVMSGTNKLCRSRMFRTSQPNMVPIEVHRDLLVNGVDFNDPTAPALLVQWWCVSMDALWRPVFLSGDDYQCSGNGPGGSFAVTP